MTLVETAIVCCVCAFLGGLIIGFIAGGGAKYERKIPEAIPIDDDEDDDEDDDVFTRDADWWKKGRRPKDY